MRLKGRVAMVTGGGSGIGRATAMALAREGAAVAIVDIDAAAAQAAAGELKAIGADAIALCADVSLTDDVEAAVGAITQRWQAMTIIVNSAGIDPHGSIETLEPQTFDRCLAVNVGSIFVGARCAAGLIERSGGGSIVNLSSVMSGRTASGYTAYTSAKAAVEGLTRALALELGPRGIRVNAIAPGFIDTPLWDAVVAAKPDPEAFADEIRRLHPVGRRGTPSDVADAAVFLCSDAAGFITGHTLVVDGGITTRLRTEPLPV